MNLVLLNSCSIPDQHKELPNSSYCSNRNYFTILIFYLILIALKLFKLVKMSITDCWDLCGILVNEFTFFVKCLRWCLFVGLYKKSLSFISSSSTASSLSRFSSMGSSELLFGVHTITMLTYKTKSRLDLIPDSDQLWNLLRPECGVMFLPVLMNLWCICC